MADRERVWTLMGDAMQAFVPFYQGAMQEAIADTSVPESWFALYLAQGCAPQPFDVDHYHQLAPFAKREGLVERLEGLVRADLMERVGAEAYRLSDLGREAVEGIFAVAHERLGAVEPLPAAEMAQLGDLLFRIVTATLAAPEPAEKPGLQSSRWTDPGAGAPPSVLVDQYLTDLARYRDDAHSAAWKPYGVGGAAWEAFTFVWRAEASTAEALAEQLPYRGRTAAEYAQLLTELADRGWVEGTADGYQVTEKGRTLRQEAEDETDRYYFVGWSSLTDDELETLDALLARLIEALRIEALRQIWGLCGELPRHINALSRDAVVPLFEEHGLDQPGMFAVVYRANGLAPEPVTADGLAIGNPYSNPVSLRDRLSQAAERDLVAADGDGAYRLAEKGKRALDAANHAFYTRLGEIDGLPAEDMARLESLMGRIASDCRQAPEPAVKAVVTIVHNGHPGREYGPLAKIDQHLDDLRAFRDDVHLAAWEPYGVSGRAWEAFTFVWRDQARSAAQLQERLAGRGHTVEGYQRSLVELLSLGWLEEDGEGYGLTDQGRSLRQEAEALTDRMFYAPWAGLSGGEIAQFHRLLTQLRDTLAQMSATPGDNS